MDDHKYKNQFWGYSVKTSVRKTGRTTFTEKSPVSMSAAVVNDEYNGQFKVIDATGGDGVFRVRVVNGADPESLICGHTDLGEVSAVTLTPTKSDRVVRLEAKWDSAAEQYIQTLKCVSKTNDGVPSFILADLSFRKKSVSQVWENGTVLWRESYWV